jgi:hypothetical protein
MVALLEFTRLAGPVVADGADFDGPLDGGGDEGGGCEAGGAAGWTSTAPTSHADPAGRGSAR